MLLLYERLQTLLDRVAERLRLNRFGLGRFFFLRWFGRLGRLVFGLAHGQQPQAADDGDQRGCANFYLCVHDKSSIEGNEMRRLAISTGINQYTSGPVAACNARVTTFF